MKLAKTIAGAVSVLAILNGAATAQTAEQNAVVVGKPVPAFSARLLKLSADKVEETEFDSAKTGKPTLYGFIGTSCPVTAQYSARLKDLAEKYQAKGVNVVYVYSTSYEDRDKKVEFHRAQGFSAALLDDQGAKVKNLLGAVRSTEMFVADANGKIVYHGAVDDSARDPGAVKVSYVAQALDETLAGKPVSVTSSQVFACGIH